MAQRSGEPLVPAAASDCLANQSPGWAKRCRAPRIASLTLARAVRLRRSTTRLAGRGGRAARGVGGEHALVVRPDAFIAFARGRLETFDIEHPGQAAPDLDQ